MILLIAKPTRSNRWASPFLNKSLARQRFLGDNSTTP